MFNRTSPKTIYTQHYYVIMYQSQPCTVHILIFCDFFWSNPMNEVKFALLFILVVYLQKHYKAFQLFVTLVLRGGGGGGSKRKLRELNFLSDIDILTSSLNFSASYICLLCYGSYYDTILK